MKQQWNTSFRLTLCAMALAGTSMVSAQTQPAPQVSPAAPMQGNPAPSTETPTTEAQRMEMQRSESQRTEAQHNQAQRTNQQMQRDRDAGKASSSKYATPQQHEAAAVAGERKKGVGPGNPPGAQKSNDFERNALRRCEVFKTDDDRSACEERVRQPQISGSVQGGGVIREYTQTVQVPATTPPAGQYNSPTTAPQPMQPMQTQPMQTQPMQTQPIPTQPMQPPVQPIRQ